MRKAYSLVFVLALAAAVVAGAQGMGSYSETYGRSANSPAVPAGMIDYGYPHVLATVNVDPGQKASITVPDQYASGKVPGYMTISIPAGAFSVPVRFEVLAGTNAYWDRKVASNLTVVANFAYRVVDRSTGTLVDRFEKPVTYSVSDPMITADSVYWATTASQPIKLVNANQASQISGDTLEHPTPVSTVGWIVTTPKAEVASRM